jgi:hypothetical protein
MPPDEIMRCVTMHDEGMPIEEIAAILHRDRTDVSGAIKSYLGVDKLPRCYEINLTGAKIPGPSPKWRTGKRVD